MLSDEENKMLEIFKKEVEKEQNEYEQVNEYTKFYYNNHKFILNLIEKQSKEIEELNKALMTATLKIEGLKIEAVYNDNYISKDKIKAKINELEEKLKIAKNSTIGIQIYDEIREQIRLLYSLL